MERIRDEFGERRAAAQQDAHFKPRRISPTESEKDRVPPTAKKTKTPLARSQQGEATVPAAIDDPELLEAQLNISNQV